MSDGDGRPDLRLVVNRTDTPSPDGTDSGLDTRSVADKGGPFGKRYVQVATPKFDREGWEDHLATCDLARSTVGNYRALGQRLADWLTDRNLNPHRPQPRHVRQWSDRLPTSQSTRDHARSMLREFAAWQGLDADPLREAVWRPKTAPKPRWRSLPPSTVTDLLAVARQSGNAGTAVMLGLYGALRRSEIAGVRWDRIDLEQGQAEVWRPKNKDWHLIPLHPQLAARLEGRQMGLPDVGPDIPWVFPGRHGGHVAPGTIGSWVKKIARQAGHPDVSPHDLRHTCATAIYDDTKDIVLAQTMLGHTSPIVTARYVRPNREAVRNAVESLNWAA